MNKSKHVVITGGSRGIGKGLAEEFLKAGCRVTINGRSSERLSASVELLDKTYSGRISGFTCDMTDRDSVQVFCKNAGIVHGDIDIWINNAGIDQPRKKFWEITEEESRRVFDVNITGTVNGCTVAAKQMLSQGYGIIYNMEGLGSDGRITDMFSFYGASKRAISYLTDSFRTELKNTPVKIAVLSPGIVVTDFLKNGLPGKPSEREKTIKMYNILADKSEDVTAFLAKSVLADNGKRTKIAWLTGSKATFRFMRAPFIKRDLFH